MKKVALGTAVLVLVFCIFTCSCASKASDPSGVVDKVEVGMTVEEVLENVDQEYFLEEDAFATMNVSDFKGIGDIPDYKNVSVWFYFGSMLRAVDPAIVVFRSDTVIAVGRVSLYEALGVLH